MKVKLQAVTPNAEVNIVEIARVSSSRKDKTEAPEGLLNYLIKNKHWSPFEHAYMTLEIKTSKAIGIQLLRHRSFTFQEFSQRYAKVTEIEPISIRKQAATNRQSSEEEFDPLINFKNDYLFGIVQLGGGNKASFVIDRALEQLQILYNELIEAGVAKECARMILPMATSTTIYMTGNVRSWIHFIQLRDDGHAQLEAQEIAREIKTIFNEQFPIISKALTW